jgi:hypothetical protein
MNTRYWVIVASKDHAQRGVREGFVQANHGKAAPLKRMRAGDGVVFYSPKTVFGMGEPCQRFTAIGTVRDDEVYQVDMGDGFVPFRRNVDFLDCREAEILPLIDQLRFIKNKRNWGYVFRLGCFEIPQDDFMLIAKQMLPNKATAVFAAGERQQGNPGEVGRINDS